MVGFGFWVRDGDWVCWYLGYLGFWFVCYFHFGFKGTPKAGRTGAEPAPRGALGQLSGAERFSQRASDEAAWADSRSRGGC